MWLGNTNAITLNFPHTHFLFLPSTSYAEHEAINSGISLGWLGPAFLAMPTPNSLCSLCPSLVGWVRGRKGLDCVKSDQQYKKSPVLPKLFPARIQNTALNKPLWRILTLFQPRPAQVAHQDSSLNLRHKSKAYTTGKVKSKIEDGGDIFIISDESNDCD